MIRSLKIKYNVSEQYYPLINKYRIEFASMLHCAYNYIRKNGYIAKKLDDYLRALNNIELKNDSFLRMCCASYARELYNKNPNKLIFGGRKNFLRLIKGLITKDEYKEKRKIYWVVGDARYKGNRRFWINSDLKSFLFRPNRYLHIELKINGEYKNYRSILEKLYKAQELKTLPITYKLEKEYIILSFDNKILQENICYKSISNRIFAIDMNPNYIGYSVVNWKSGNNFKIIESGTISIKKINDINFLLNGKGVSTESKERKYITNKRHHEIFEISKHLTKLAKHYQCEYFAIEKLKTGNTDKGLGRRFNKLVNNCWNHTSFINNIKKRCELIGIQIQEVVPEYSSFVGNILYRDINRPDMELASIEIGRRCYEFVHQYIKKDKDIRKSIVLSNIIDFADRFTKSLEEFSIQGEINNLLELYKYLKKSKYKYRLSLDLLPDLKFSRYFSNKSLVYKNYCLTV